MSFVFENSNRISILSFPASVPLISTRCVRSTWTKNFNWLRLGTSASPTNMGVALVLRSSAIAFALADEFGLIVAAYQANTCEYLLRIHHLVENFCLNSDSDKIMMEVEKTHEAKDSKNKLYPIFVRKSNSDELKNKSKTVVCSATANNDTFIISHDDSESSLENVPLTRNFSKNVPLTRKFSTWEQWQMVQYLINNHRIAEAKGIRVWEDFIGDGFLKHRTPQSLNNNFRRYLLPKIHRFRLKASILKKFCQLYK